MTTDITFGRTPLGQLLYDLAFAKLTDRWIARKHRIPIGRVREMRKAALDGLRRPKRRKGGRQ